MLRAILVRVGIDQAYGNWNGPADPKTRRFVYVPIPESIKTTFRQGTQRSFNELLPVLARFASDVGTTMADLSWPASLNNRFMHLDPDFSELTYGDDGRKRGSEISRLSHGDLLVFYSGLRSVKPPRKLIYGLIGVLLVDHVIKAIDVPFEQFHRNAHTRKDVIAEEDIVVMGIRGRSGLFRHFISIGSYRDRAYRVRSDLLAAWGGLSVVNGFIQRSVRPPSFNDPIRFVTWLEKQNVELIEANHENARH